MFWTIWHYTTHFFGQDELSLFLANQFRLFFWCANWSMISAIWWKKEFYAILAAKLSMMIPNSLRQKEDSEYFWQQTKGDVDWPGLKALKLTKVEHGIFAQPHMSKQSEWSTTSLDIAGHCSLRDVSVESLFIYSKECLKVGLVIPSIFRTPFLRCW
jgi:hypothetical protein